MIFLDTFSRHGQLQISELPAEKTYKLQQKLKSYNNFVTFEGKGRLIKSYRGYDDGKKDDCLPGKVSVHQGEGVWIIVNFIEKTVSSQAPGHFYW